jgi:hypothetical protein
MNHLLFALCYQLTHHARWLPFRRGKTRVGRRCLCGRHSVWPRRRLPEIVGTNRAMTRLMWLSKKCASKPPKGYRPILQMPEVNP